MVKNLPANGGDVGSIPGLGRSPGEGNGNPLQYSYLKNPMDRGAWQATVHGFAIVRHNLATKQQGTTKSCSKILVEKHGRSSWFDKQRSYLLIH